MKKGMVAALGAVGVVAAGWVGATWYAGTKIEARVDGLLKEANQHLAERMPFVSLKMERLDYQRGVFSSQARYALVLERELDAGGFLPPDFPAGSIELDTRIAHGPFPWARLAGGHFAPVLAASHSELIKTDKVARLFELTGGVPFYSDDSVIHYDGRVESSTRLAAIHYEDRGRTLAFSGLDLNVQADAIGFKQTAVKMDGRIDEFRVDMGDKFRFLMSNITLASDNTMGKFDVMNGDVSMKAGRIEFVGSDSRNSKGNVTIDDFVYRVGMSENDTALSVEVAYGLEKLVFQRPAPRPVNMDFGGGEIVIKLDNLNAAALQELAEAYVGIMQGIMAKRSDAALKAAILPGLLAAGEKLIVNKPALTIAPRWRTDAGESSVRFSVGIMAPPNLVDMLASQRLPDDLALQLIERIDVDLSVSRPQAESVLARIAEQERGMTPEQAAAEAAQQIRAMAGMAEMLNIAKNDGDKLVGSFRYADGVARLNGTEVPLGDYLPNLTDMAGAGADMDDDDEYDDDHDDFDDDDDHDHDDDDHDHDHD